MESIIELGVIAMARSKAKKLREKLAREGKMNPEAKRSPFVLTDMRTRMTKTKKDHMYQFKHKNHQSQEGYDGSFYFCEKRARCFSSLHLFTCSLWASSIEISLNVTHVPGTACASNGISTDITVPILV
jgi:hypothetical protein